MVAPHASIATVLYLFFKNINNSMLQVIGCAVWLGSLISSFCTTLMVCHPYFRFWCSCNSWRQLWGHFIRCACAWRRCQHVAAFR